MSAEVVMHYQEVVRTDPCLNGTFAYAFEIVIDLFADRNNMHLGMILRVYPYSFPFRLIHIRLPASGS